MGAWIVGFSKDFCGNEKELCYFARPSFRLIVRGNASLK
jgi:hypothetical protein